MIPRSRRRIAAPTENWGRGATSAHGGRRTCDATSEVVVSMPAASEPQPAVAGNGECRRSAAAELRGGKPTVGEPLGAPA